VKAVLEPSDTETGASDLNLVVEEQTINASFSYDNYGTLYLGPHQTTYQVAANSIFLPGDSTSFTFLNATHGKELRYGDLSYATYLGNHGLLLTLDGNKSLTFPGFFLRPLLTRGNASTYSIDLQYPLIRERDRNLTLEGNFSYTNSKSTQLSELLYLDRLRPAFIGATYSFSDDYKGSNVMALRLKHGFNIMNASDDPNSLFTSRFGADAIFTKWAGQISRTQLLFDRFSAFFIAQGQYSYQPLLVEEQFGFGGSQLGRGYDPAEILGDRGAAASVELRMDNYPDIFKINAIQMYAFYDAGVIWNIKNIPNSFTKQSATSTGLGARVNITQFINGNVMITQPLTKKVAAEELIGRGKCPRIFFSVTAQI
jgi:hemolysin activation/secretion protein